MEFSTRAIHAGQEPEENFGAVIPPIYMTSTFAQEEPGKYKGYDYTRAGNPNFTNLEKCLAALENGQHATVFSSGLGGMSALLSTLTAGDKVICIDDVYGGTYRLFTKVFAKFNFQFEFMNMDDLQVLEKALQVGDVKVLWVETPTNPLLKIVDIRTLAQLSKKYGVKLVVDNTFATPYLQNPLDLGADVVVHSSTKYLGGHSDVIGGAVITNDVKLKEELDFMRKAMGFNPSPFDVWLTHRGVKTLAVRMQKHCENAMMLAQFFSSHPKVARVYYPGLQNDAGYAVASQQMRSFGGMISVEFKIDFESAKKLMKTFKVFTLAESLGGVESLVDHPASMTHASIPKEERDKIGLTDGLFRFSVGIEDSKDLLADFAEL